MGLFGKWKKQKDFVLETPHSVPDQSGLLLGSDDRDVVAATPSSAELARKILSDARELAHTKKSGETFTASVQEPNCDVHHMELMLSMMLNAPEYGLEVTHQHDNSFGLRKL